MKTIHLRDEKFNVTFFCSVSDFESVQGAMRKLGFKESKTQDFPGRVFVTVPVRSVHDAALLETVVERAALARYQSTGLVKSLNS